MTSFIAIFLVALYTSSCSSGGSTQSGTSDQAVCVWDNVSLKSAPSEDGKWVCGISIGEIVTYLDDSKEDNSEKKTIKYYNVKLKDEKEGWVQSDFIVLNSKAGAIVDDSEIYSRPDLLNKTGNYFSKMDIVAVKSEKDGFIEVVGKRKNGKWIETGWLKNKSITFDPIDIAVAKYGRKAIDISDINKRNEAIREIVNNPDFSNSIFLSSLPGIEQPKVEETISDTTKTE